MRKVRVISKKLCFLFINVLVLMRVQALDTTLIQRFDLKTKNLNKSAMKTKVLYDRVYPFAKLNTQLFSEKERISIIKNYQYWKQVYLELYNASYETQLKYNLIELEEQVFDYKIQSSKIPIAFIHYQYEFIDSNAYNDGRLEIREGELYSLFNTGKSVYLIDTINVLSIMQNEIPAGLHKLYYDDVFYFSNCHEKIKEINIMFEDRPSIRLLPGDTTQILLSTVGNHPYSYKVIYTDGTSYYDTAFIKVVNAGTPPCEYKTGSTTNAFLDYTHKLAGCNYELGFYYNTCQSRNSELLYKPILVLDGFDPSDSRKVGNIYDLMNAAPVNLASYLREQGHDIIIMNFPKGADYLERNALGVMQMIEYIKARTKDQLSVIGPSMGGLLAKYAIANLEKQNIDHQVGLYVSFDAPHQGANIPIGAQYFLKFFGENIGHAAALEGLQKVKSPAARQMLIHHYLSNSIYPLPDSFRKQYKLADTKYPTRTRNISLINGSETMTEQGLYAELFTLQYAILFNRINLANAKVYTSSSSGASIVADLSARNPNKLFIKENMYKLSSTPLNTPYPSSLDNAPGGTFNTQQQLTHDVNGNLLDGFTMYYSKHCFIPSVSALDIYFPDGFVNYKIDIKNAELICRDLIPFDAYYAPNTNEEHVAIHLHSEKWIKRELRNGNKKTEITSVQTIFKNKDVYNYGSNTKDFFSKPFTFSDGALFGVNMNSATGYANESIPTPLSQFTVEAYNTSCTTLLIDIKDRAKIQLGDANKNIGVLKISENSKLYIHDEAELLIHDYSTLIIEKGSSLNIGKNVNVKLLGKNAKIIVYGQLIIEDEAIFSFSGEGLLVLNTKEVILKRNAHINIQGKNKNDLKIQVINGNKIPFPIQRGSSNSLQITNAKIQFTGNESYINAAISIYLEEVTIEGGRGIILNGQKAFTIKNCDFLNNKTGLTYYANNMEGTQQASSALALSDNNFINSETAIELIGKGFVLTNIRMSNVQKAIDAKAMEWPSMIVNSTIVASANQVNLNSTNAAIRFYGLSGSSLTIINSNISDFTIGVFITNATLNLKCTEILNCRRNAIYLHNGASLNMSYSTNQVAGNNTLSILQGYNNSLICLDDAGTIRLENGANKLKLAAKDNVYFIAGTSRYIPNSINLKQNNWYTNRTTYENNPSSSYFYISQNTAPASPRVQNFIILPILANTVVYECDASAQQNTAIHIEMDVLDCLKDLEKTTLLNQEHHRKYLSHQCYLSWYANLAAQHNLSTEIIQDKLNHLTQHKSYTHAIYDTTGLYNAVIDEANYYGSISSHEQAYTLLNTAYAFAKNSSAIQYIHHLRCLAQCREDNLSQQYSLTEIDSLLQSCKYEYKISTTAARINKNQINTMEVKPIELIPNPTDRFFDVVVNDDAKIYSVSVFSSQGELLSDFAVTNSDKIVRVDMESFKPGLYLVSIKTSEKEYIRKIIVTSAK